MMQKFVFLFFLTMNALFLNAIQIPTIYKKQLSNGLTVLVRPADTMQKVSVQVWYNIGSKDEDLREKGLAHFIEHMIFKGTEILSESDIPEITKILSGYANAMTSYDTTNYLFNLPPAYWKEALPLIADCMKNCTFKEDILNAELKAVIAEMKKYHDDFKRILIQKLIGSIFPDHPYHYPIIGFKQDLWNLSRANLHEFYKKHYLPNNATLVIIGKVDPQEAFELTEKYFSSIEPNFAYKKNRTHLASDISAQTVILYRDVQVPYVVLGWVIPGFRKKLHPTISLVHSVLTGGKMSRLHHLLVDQLQLVTSVGSLSWALFDHDVFLIACEPKKIDDLQLIIDHIQKELTQLAREGLTTQELDRICKQYQTQQYDTLENNYGQASLLGKSYSCLQDEYYPYIDHWSDRAQHNKKAREFVQDYLRPSVMHKGILLPLSDDEKGYWTQMQKASDNEDAALLAGRIRESAVEPVAYASELSIPQVAQSTYPVPKIINLSNGLTVFYYHKPSIPKISASIMLKADEYYDSETLPGLYRILATMLVEGGTKQHTADEIAELIEANAIGLNMSPGSVDLNVLKEDFETALELSRELLSEPNFDEQALEKVRDWTRRDYKYFLQNPDSIAFQKIKEYILPFHPKSKNSLGTPESIEKITREDLFHFHNVHISPDQASMAIVGDLDGIDLKNLLENTIGLWRGPKIEDIKTQIPKTVKSKTITIEMQRDQTVLIFGGLSVDRNHPDYEKLLLFEQLFGNGIGSKLFELREKSGAFYSIRGSLISGSGKYPGMFFVHTAVSNDRLQEAENLITEAIEKSIDSVMPHELEAAKRRVLLAPDDFYSTNGSIASAFLFLNEFELPWDYFTKLTERINAITLDEVKTAVKKVLRTDAMVTIKVGRVS